MFEVGCDFLERRKAQEEHVCAMCFSQVAQLLDADTSGTGLPCSSD